MNIKFGCSLSLVPVKSRLVLPFWYRLTWLVPDKGPLSGCSYFISPYRHMHGVDVACRYRWSGVICVCLLLTAVILAKAAELMEMPFRGVRLM